MKYGEGDVVNASWGPRLVVNDADFEKYKRTMVKENGVQNVRVFNITLTKINLPRHLQSAPKIWDEGSWVIRCRLLHDVLTDQYRSNGLLIFITGFLGLVFLISTGSILYFKQMTEAEQERKSYATLRQLGFTVKDIMRGIIRKQAFVFGLPLLIGLLHSVFAIKAASFPIHV